MEMVIRRMQRQSASTKFAKTLSLRGGLAFTQMFSLKQATSTTAIFSSHRFILISCFSYFYAVLLSWPSNKNVLSNGEPPTLTPFSPPFTPASLHFALGFI